MSSVKKKKNNKRWAIVSIASIPLVMTLGNSMLIPVLPTMEKELEISAFQSSLIITVYSVVAIFFIPLAGFLSDKIGRKMVIIPSLIIAGLGGLLAAFVSWKMKDAFWLLLLGRMMQGIGAAGAFPIVLPLVGDMFRTDKEISSSLGIIETGNTLGKVLSPIIGAILASFIWYLPFFAIPIFCLVSILLLAFLVHSPKNEKSPPFKEFLIGLKETFKFNSRWLTSLFIIGGNLMFILFGILFYLSNMLEEQFKIGDIKKGFILAIPLGALCLASFITGKKIKDNKVAMKWITFIGSIILSGGVFFLNGVNRLWFAIGLFVIVGIGIGIALPCLDALITQGIEKDRRGTISSLYSSMRFVGVALGPPILAILMKYWNQYIFFFIGAIGVLTGLICLFGIHPERPDAEEEPKTSLFVKIKS